MVSAKEGNERMGRNKKGFLSPKRKPTYHTMVSTALMRLQGSNRHGVSAVAIRKFIESRYEVVSSFRTRLQHSLKQGVAEGWLVQIRRSYKLSSEERQRLKRQQNKTKDQLEGNQQEPPYIMLQNTQEYEEGTESDVEYRKRIRKRVKRRLFSN